MAILNFKQSGLLHEWYLLKGSSLFNVGWVRHAVCAVTHQACRQALLKQNVVLLRNAWWVTALRALPTLHLSLLR